MKGGENMDKYTWSLDELTHHLTAKNLKMMLKILKTE